MLQGVWSLFASNRSEFTQHQARGRIRLFEWRSDERALITVKLSLRRPGDLLAHVCGHFCEGDGPIAV